MEVLVQSQGGSTTVSLEFMSSYKLDLAVSIDLPFMTLTALAHIFPPPFLWISEAWLYAWLWISAFGSINDWMKAL